MTSVTASSAHRPDGRDYLPRPQLIAALRNALAQTGRVAIVDKRPSSLGFGKTELAAEYVRAFGQEYENVFWLRADRPAVFRAEFAELALRLGLPDRLDHDLATMTNAVERRLKNSESWLLVADGTQDVAALIHFFANVSTGHLVVTSRSNDWPPPFEKVHVPGFESAEIGEYLNDRNGELGRLNGNSAALETLSVPLVARLVTAYCRHSGTRLTSAAELLAVQSSGNSSEGTLDDPARSLIPLLNRKLDLLRTEDAAAAQLALLCAHLDSGFISPDLLATERAFVPSQLSERLADPNGLMTVFGRLVDFSLLRTGIDTVSMNSAVQRAILLDLTDTEKREWAKRTVQLVLDAFPQEERYQGYVRACSRLLGTALGAADLCVRLDCELDAAGTLLNRVGQYLHGFGDDKAARECLEYAARIALRLAGPQSPMLALRLNNLGAAELVAGAHESARDRFEQALLIVKDEEDANKDLMSEILRNLANAHLACDDLDAARIWLKEALGRYVHFYGYNHVHVAECLNLLGVVFAKSGREPQALKSFGHAVRIGRIAQGCDPALLASYLGNLGDALRERGDLAAAEACIAEALELYSSVFGDDHERTAQYLVQLGRIMRRRRNYDDAIDCFERAFRLTARDGPDSTSAILARQVGRTCVLTRDYRVAFDWYRRSLSLYDAQSETSNATLIEVLVEAGTTALKADDENEAETYLQRALGLLQDEDECDDGQLARVLSGIGEVEERRGHFEASHGYYDRARVLQTNKHGKNHPLVAGESLNVGRCLREMGRGLEAVANVAFAERIFAETLGTKHPKTRRARELLARCRD